MIEAVGYDSDGNERSRYAIRTAGEPAALKITAFQNPEGFKADGHDLAMIQFEVVDKDGQRCPLDNRTVNFTVSGEGEWRGGIAQGPSNCILSKALPVECGVNRALIRSTVTPSVMKVTAQADGLPEASVEFKTEAVDVWAGLGTYLPAYTLPVSLVRGETPLTPSYKDSRRTVNVVECHAGSNNDEAALSYDDNELSSWKSDGVLSNAWITYRLEEPAAVDDICIKLNGWRRKSYPLEVYAGKHLIWSGKTEKSLGYIHLEIAEPVETDVITVSMKGSSNENDAFGELTEVAGNAANEMETRKSSRNELDIIISPSLCILFHAYVMLFPGRISELFIIFGKNNFIMEKLNKPAILVVDMLNDFVTGALTCDRAKAIVPATARLLDAARKAGVPVIFCNDAHIAGIDRELKIWGDHAIAGTKGAEVIPELNLSEGDYVVPKRRYSGFFQTDLDILLRELGVRTVVMTGLHAHMCVRHTSADAFCLGYDVVVAKEATDSFTEEDYKAGLAYLKTCYGAEAYSNDELIAAF